MTHPTDPHDGCRKLGMDIAITNVDALIRKVIRVTGQYVPTVRLTCDRCGRGIGLMMLPGAEPIAVVEVDATDRVISVNSIEDFDAALASLDRQHNEQHHA